MIVPTFDRWRAKIIANLDPASAGELDAIQFCPVAPSIAAVCPFLRFDGEPCEQLISYYFRAGSGEEGDLSTAMGACHRHIGHAFDVLVLADRVGLEDACDEDAVDASIPALPAVAPHDAESEALRGRLLASGRASAAGFGTTILNEGYPVVAGASVTFTPAESQSLRTSGIVALARTFGFTIDDEAGIITIATAVPESAEEWICQNRALRELVRDLLDDTIDPLGYRYRAIADDLPPVLEIEPRIYTSVPAGTIELRVHIAATPAERTWDEETGAARRHVLNLHVDRLPRPGDYLDVAFARYRFVRVDAGSSAGVARADTVLDRLKQPSRN